ncbi:CsbD family protein probably involved in stress response [Corynebacterium kutscheri]|uniref:CsbD family protein probably involved in stress response n=1 Tax=Corynebacterium kutscheri TaxID=35755 RepID=A0A0F6R0E4_9CORY|nr:CsbD family protein [Corynebacterium kutscheri]AKE40358.1 CsbD-like protein [Corynebacterium kutscheri]VEH05365.1 CsbD family protein probably involved in stress response [Corynebacterium kutscheri]VEH10752.1 CsbD family protein probably involved in stress response [Corynebacterium kutscheri]VEH80768.1 CsbD family protein probably involved in stress response [Corynebacterium kutscheri]
MSNLSNKFEDVAGKAKEAIGEATDNEKLENEGKKDQVVSDVKEAVDKAGESIKDAANKVIGSFKKDDDQ